MILKLDLQTGFDHWDLLTVIVALWVMWPYLLYISGDGTKASGRGRDTLKQVGYDTDKWEVKAGAKYALHPPSLVKIERSGNYWNVVEGSASKFDQKLPATGTDGDIPF
jgi:hypothetical protein